VPGAQNRLQPDLSNPRAAWGAEPRLGRQGEKEWLRGKPLQSSLAPNKPRNPWKM